MSFESLELDPQILKALSEKGYTKPSPIQAKAIPAVLSGKDVMAAAQTGTGKTAGFTLPMLQALTEKKHTQGKPYIKALILTPTRELASQVAENIEAYSRYLPLKSAVIFGGIRRIGQVASKLVPSMVVIYMLCGIFIIIIYMSIMVFGSIIFAKFWIETTNMGPEAVAKQIQGSGMQIPGFRRDPRIVEKVLERYIPTVTVFSGAMVGFLAAGADMIGTVGQSSGTGVLLTVGIMIRMYEQIGKEQMMEMHPVLRSFFGEE